MTDPVPPPDPTDRAAQTHSSAWGFDYEEWSAGYFRMSCLIRPMHLNGAGTVHGGVLLTMMDEAGALAGVYTGGQPRQRSVTISLAGQFTGQAQAGRIIAIGTLQRSGRKIYFSRTEITTEAGELIAFGSSTHRLITPRL